MKYIPLFLVFLGCSRVIPTKNDNLCHLDSVKGLRKGDTIELAIEGKYLGVTYSGAIIIDKIEIGRVLCNSTHFKIIAKDSIWLIRPHKCKPLPLDSAYHLVYVEDIKMFNNGEKKLIGGFSKANYPYDTCFAVIRK